MYFSLNKECKIVLSFLFSVDYTLRFFSIAGAVMLSSNSVTTTDPPDIRIYRNFHLFS